jgi:pilus assembly protein Flp/PilA
MWNDIMPIARSLFAKLVEREEGQGLVEYSLILALISVVAIALLTSVGGDITDVLKSVTGAFSSAL